MVGFLLNIKEPIQADAADALAVAICHSNLLNSAELMKVSIKSLRKRRR